MTIEVGHLVARLRAIEEAAAPHVRLNYAKASIWLNSQGAWFAFITTLESGAAPSAKGTTPDEALDRLADLAAAMVGWATLGVEGV